MTGIVEHKSFRYTWELVRHSYLVDIGSEIGIQQVEISSPGEHRMLEAPYPATRFFEVEIDQIQKNGRTVFSFRNICPVQVDQRREEPNLLSRGFGKAGRNITKRFHAQEGETETRWLYTNDFFLISLSSGDRHDLIMLLNLILGRLNMIALSILSGKRVSSEFENQLEYRNSIGMLFSGGIEGAFRDVPVYRQHGEVTGSVPDGSTPVLSAPADRATSTRPAVRFCGNCGGALSGTAKFCGSCGTPVRTTPQAENAAGKSAPADGTDTSSGTAGGADSDKTPSGSRPEARLVIDVKTVEELHDLSWLSE